LRAISSALATEINHPSSARTGSIHATATMQSSTYRTEAFAAAQHRNTVTFRRALLI